MLIAEERQQYMEDVSHVAEFLHELFHQDRNNFGAYGDTMYYLYFHLVPKYKDGFEWGDVFAMDPHEVMLAHEEYNELTDRYDPCE